MSGPARAKTTRAGCLLVFTVAWGLSIAYLAATGSDLVLPVMSMVVGGAALPALIVHLTRHTKAPPAPVERPTRELAFVLVYLIVYAFYFLGWALGAVRDATQPGLYQDLVLLVLKLGVGVSGPAVMLYLVGAQVAPLFDPGLKRPGFWPVLLVVGPTVAAMVVFGSGSPKLAHAAALPPSVLLWATPATFVFIAVQCVSEEFLYRAVLQSRLAAVLEDRLGAVLIAALLFSLAHAPGIYLRGDAETLGDSTDLAKVVAYCVGVMTPVGILYGAIWARTRSLLLVSLVHACLSFSPKIAEMAAALSG